jgi:hypothetical protein
MKKMILIMAIFISFNIAAQTHIKYNNSISNYLIKEMDGVVKTQKENNNTYITQILPPSSINQEIIILYINSLLYNNTEVKIISEWKKYGKSYKIKFIMDDKFIIIIEYFLKTKELLVITTN